MKKELKAKVFRFPKHHKEKELWIKKLYLSDIENDTNGPVVFLDVYKYEPLVDLLFFQTSVSMSRPLFSESLRLMHERAHSSHACTY